MTTTSTSRRLRCALPASRVRPAGAGVPWCLGQGAMPFSAAVHASRQAAPSWAPAALHRSHTLLLTRAFSARSPLPAGADLSNLLNEAAILTGRRNKEGISQREIDDSIDRIVAGAPCCCCVRHGAWPKTPRPAQLAPWLLRLAYSGSVQSGGPLSRHLHPCAAHQACTPPAPFLAGMEGTPMTDGRSKMLVAYHEVRTVPAGQREAAARLPRHTPPCPASCAAHTHAPLCTWCACPHLWGSSLRSTCRLATPCAPP